MMAKRITINDIAKSAGASRTTVSNFLNDKPKSMSEETRKRIQETIQELNYHPNRQARALRLNSSLTIGVVVADIANSYTSRLLRGILNGLDGTLYNAIVMDSEDSKATEQKNIQKILDEQISGLIFQPVGNDSEDYAILRERKVPVVQADRRSDPLVWSAVVSDNYQQSQNLVKLIRQKGYQRIVVVSDPILGVSSRVTRFEGLEDALKGTGIELRVLIKDDEHLWENLLASVEDDVRTAIYAFNSDAIFQVMNFLNEKEIHVPEQVGVVGYDGEPWASLIAPGITTVEQHPVAIGEKAMVKLLELIENPDQPPETIEVSSRLNERKSL
jgi:LacI family kdg operon repressor